MMNIICKLNVEVIHNLNIKPKPLDEMVLSLDYGTYSNIIGWIKSMYFI